MSIDKRILSIVENKIKDLSWYNLILLINDEFFIRPGQLTSKYFILLV